MKDEPVSRTSKDRSLPELLRAAERRVNAHVFRQPGDDSLASIPANRDRDVDLLLCEAADEIERLMRERDEAREHTSTAAFMRLEAERDEWARKWHRVRAELAELKYPGMKGIVRPLSGEPASKTEKNDG